MTNITTVTAKKKKPYQINNFMLNEIQLINLKYNWKKKNGIPIKIAWVKSQQVLTKHLSHALKYDKPKNVWFKICFGTSIKI